MRDEVRGPRLERGVGAPDVLAEDAQGQQLHGADRRDDDDGGRPAGDGAAEQQHRDRVQEHPDGGDAAEEPEPGGEAQRRDREPGDAVDREPDHLAERVLGLPGGAGLASVADRGAREAERGDDETEHPVVLGQGVDGVDGGPRHQPEVPGVDVGVDVGHRPDRAVEQPGRGALERGVAGAVLTDPVDDVDALRAGRGEHLADDLGRVLEVGVDGDDVVAPGPGQAGRDRRLVAGVGAQPHHAHLRPLPAQPLEQHGRRVVGAVVDAEHLVADPPALRHRPQPVDEQRQDLLLVVHRDDHGEVDVGGMHALKGRSRPVHVSGRLPCVGCARRGAAPAEGPRV